MGKRLHFRPGNVGRVGDDHIIFPEKCRGFLRGVRLNAPHPPAETVQAGVFLGDGQRLHAQICQRHLRVLDPAGNGKADAAGTAAQIQNPGVLLQKQRLADGKLGHGASIVPGNQHIRRHPKGQAVKLPLPQHIGQRLPVQQPPDGAAHIPANLLGRIQVTVCQNGFRTFPGKMAQQLPRHHPRRLGVLGFQQRMAGVQIQLAVLLHQRSEPSFSGSTACTAAMPTSIMESSGSLVVKCCIHMPGAESARVKALSFLPHQRLIS